MDIQYRRGGHTGEVGIQERWTYRRGEHTEEVGIQEKQAGNRVGHKEKLHLLDVKLEKLTPPGYQTLRNQNNIKLRFFIVLKFAIY